MDYSHPIISGSLAKQVDDTCTVGAETRIALRDLVKKMQPKVVVQVGVQSGSTTVDLMEAMAQAGTECALYAVDSNKRYFHDKTKDVGYLAVMAQEQGLFPTVSLSLMSGACVSDIVKTIEGEIDLLVADLNIAPGEMTAALVCLPHMSGMAQVFFPGFGAAISFSAWQLAALFPAEMIETVGERFAKYDRQTLSMRQAKADAAKNIGHHSDADFDFLKKRNASLTSSVEFYKDQLAKREEGLAFFKDQLAKREEGLAFYKDQVAKKEEGIAFFKDQVSKKEQGIEYYKKRMEHQRATEEYYRKFAEAKMRESARCRARLDEVEGTGRGKTDVSPEPLPEPIAPFDLEEPAQD